MLSLGIDTSNYTTSVAVYDSETNEIIQKKKLLPVKKGEKGLRQSDAVFHHTVQLYPLIEQVVNVSGCNISSVGVSSRPRNVENSYMPCFNVGVNTARSIASVLGVPCYSFSHQCGHISAALYSAGKFNEFLDKEFIAFHVSGGTTEMLHITPAPEIIFSAEIIGKTLDLNAGQAVDRTGVMLGLDFPCGAQLEKLALNSNASFHQKIFIKNGCCSFSGVENKTKQMLSLGYPECDIAMFCFDYIISAISKMTEFALEHFDGLPVLYAGGVMSNSIIRKELSKRFNCMFAEPEFSCDNAAGIALMAHERSKENG